MSDKSSLFPGAQALPALVALMVLGGVLWVEKPLQSKRSPDKEQAGFFRRAEESAPARLWEDPFEAISRHLLGPQGLLEARSSEFESRYCTLLNQVSHLPHSLPENAELLRTALLSCKSRKGKHQGGTESCNRSLADLDETQGLGALGRGLVSSFGKTKDNAGVLIAGVTLVGGSLSDQAEYRRRVRIAFLSALHRRGFIAASEDKLSFLLLPESAQDGRIKARLEYGFEPKSQLFPVPYEIFERRQGLPSSLPSSFGTVLILWLNEDRFETEPDHDLQRIAETLIGLPEVQKTIRNPTVALIGPESSSTLVKMLSPTPVADGTAITCSGGSGESSKSTTSSFQVFSPFATAEEEIAQMFTGEATPKERSPITRTIVDDAQVLHSLIAELGRRGIDLFGNDKVHVALVTELDTSYGQALPLTFQAAALSGEPGAAFEPTRFSEELQKLKSSSQDSSAAGILSRIKIFRYLRGLDGAAAGKPATPSASSDKGEDDSAQALRGHPERAEGPSLLDMIRSLGTNLKSYDEGLRLDGERIHAIGILGTDFYDKQLALQALRPIFPDAVFFTTDLDARYLDRDDRAWNRNLLVGSSFGFQLVDSLQEEVPPFRDVYSTSTFLAGLLALGSCTHKAGAGCDVLENAIAKVKLGERLTLQPLVFEIGITKAHQLAVEIPSKDSPEASPGTAGEKKKADSKDLLAIQPIITPSWEIPRAHKKLFFLVLLVGGISWMVSRRVRGYSPALFGVMTFLIGSFIAVDYFFAAEPSDILEGVSVRGTESLRLLLIGITVALFFKLRRKMRNVQDKLNPRFERGPGEERVADLTVGEWFHISKTFEKYENEHGTSKEDEPAAEDTVEDGPPKTGPEVEAAPAWEYYRLLQGTHHGIDRQLVRVLGMTLMAFAILGGSAWCLRGYFEFPLVPVRGSLGADKVLRYLSLGCLTFACFWALDTVRLCVRFVDVLTAGKTVWPTNSKNLRSTIRRRLPLKYLGDYLDIRVITPLTEAVSWIVLYPFFLLAIYILSRARFFDYWTWPWIVGSIVLVLLASILIAAGMLQLAARRARESTLKFLRVVRTNEAAKETKVAEARAKQLEILIQEVESIDSGAFGSWISNPIVHAVLLPFGGVSIATAIDFLLKIGM